MAKAKAVIVVTPVLHGDELLEANLSPTQVAQLQDFAGLILTHDMARDTFAAEADAIVRDVWAKPAPYEVWKPTVRAFRELSEWAATCLRASYKRVHGALPNAGDARATGKTKGASAKKFIRGVDSAVKTLTAKLAKMPRADLNAKRMARIAALVASIALEIKAEKQDLAA